MPPRFVEVEESKIVEMRDTLDLLEMLDADSIKDMRLHIYGITTNPNILDAAREAVADSEDVQEEDVQVSEVAVALPLSGDIIYYLHGSGLKLGNDDFVYRGTGGEGIRTLSFTFSTFKPRATFKDFSKLAVASSQDELVDFLQKYGTPNAAEVVPAVHRTEEATVPQAPISPTNPGIPKQTSFLLADIVNNLLG
jgi:hypothetical protein